MEDQPKESPIEHPVEKTDVLKDRQCPYCKQSYKTKVGMDNWKNLFRKPTLDDWITLFILIMLFFAAYAYVHDTKACSEALHNLSSICSQYQMQLSQQKENTLLPVFNLTIANTTIETTANTTTNTNSSNTSGQFIGGERDANASEVNTT
jgi:hypothetical protein